MAELLSGKIYKISSPNTDMVYIGSTTMTLKRRFTKHISDWRNDRQNSSKHILEKGSAIIELLEEVEVENVRELERLEQKWIEQTPNTVNRKKAYISEEDQKERNRRVMREKYSTDLEFREKMLEYQKKYQKENWEKVNAQERARYQKKKEKIQEKRSQTVVCEVCDISLVQSSLSKHKKSAKHTRNLEMSEK
jgi:hypothetical protein